MDATQKLRQAVAQGDFVAAREALQAGADPDYQEGPDIPSVLHSLVASSRFTEDKLALGRLLLEVGANPRISLGNDQSPLTDAIRQRDVGLVQLLLDFGAEVDLFFDEGRSILDWAIQEYDREVLGGGQFGLEQASPEDRLADLECRASDIGLPCPDHLPLLRHRGAHTADEIELERCIEAIQDLLDRLYLRCEVIDRNGSQVLFRYDLVGKPGGLRLVLDFLEQSPAPLLAAPEGLWPTTIHVARRRHEGCSEYLYQGVDIFIQEVRGNERRWRAHLLGGTRTREWAARQGGTSRLRVDYLNGYFRLGSDGKPLRVPRADGSELEGPIVDPVELCRSAITDDECWIFTCSCGSPGCNGFFSGIFVAHQDGLTIWRSPERPEMPLAVFPRWQYRRAILRAIRDLLRKGPWVIGPTWDNQRPRLEKAFGWARAGRSWFEGPELISHLIIE